MTHPIEETALNQEVIIYADGISKLKLTAVFETSVEFRIDVPLGDKNIVKQWFIENGSLYVTLTNGELKKYDSNSFNVNYDYPKYVDVRDLEEDEYEDILEGEIIEV